MRYTYLSHCRATKAHANLRTCANSHEPTLLAYITYGFRGKLKLKFRPLPLLNTSLCAFKEGICAYAISTKISCAGPNVLFYVIKSVLTHLSS